MRCERCGQYHRDFVPCEAVALEAELYRRCDFCTSSATSWHQLKGLPDHPSTRRYMTNEGIKAAQCPKCGAIWLMRYQWDEGTGSDNEAWVHELGRQVIEPEEAR